MLLKLCISSIIRFHCMIYFSQIDTQNDIQYKIAKLENKGWVAVSIARALHFTRDDVGKWKRGEKYRSTEKLVLDAINEILKQKCVPKHKLYVKCSCTNYRERVDGQRTQQILFFRLFKKWERCRAVLHIASSGRFGV